MQIYESIYHHQSEASSDFVLHGECRLRRRGQLLFRLNFRFNVEQHWWQVQAKCTDNAQSKRPGEEVVLEIGHPVARVAQGPESDDCNRPAESWISDASELDFKSVEWHNRYSYIPARSKSNDIIRRSLTWCSNVKHKTYIIVPAIPTSINMKQRVKNVWTAMKKAASVKQT